jgi:MYXO-CTERM domain-containing protein
MTVQHTLCSAVAAAGASTDLGALLAAAVVTLLVRREER